MFVGVDVAHRDSTRLNAPYLGHRLGLNLLFADTSAQQISEKATHCGAERGRVSRIDQRRYFSRAQGRRTIDQHDVTPDRQGRLGKSHIYCGRKKRPVRHQRRGTEGARLLEFDNRTVNARRETKVVCVNDQAFHFRKCNKRPSSVLSIEGVKLDAAARTIHTAIRWTGATIGFLLAEEGSGTMSARLLHRQGPRRASYALLLLLTQAAHAAWGLPTDTIVHQTPSIFDPHSGPAQMIHHLSLFVMQITAAIFIVVASLFVYVIVRFRQRDPSDDSEPPQIYGSTQIELAWTVIPILIVVVLFLTTARILFAIQDQKMPDTANHCRRCRSSILVGIPLCEAGLYHGE